MKTLLVITCLMFGFVFTTAAQNNPINAQERATNLSNQMIRDLALNNYQTKKIQEINFDKATKMLAVEQQYAGNQAKIDELCKGICAERDRELENVLSIVQYNRYFGARNQYNNLDREFVVNADKTNKETGTSLTSITTLADTNANSPKAN
ncbi:hypothetical protein ACFSKU_02485 [Pontibacter silvestris]|uniref:Uncharacterized protein n=1 Tax=Pontibacter silvestris TaxID=2305183 RepID=A0ABW4WSI8_9BACT|nr:hypothetical protein [Pontibacter silvestris]MCC9137738.1 hypothetical protein [Pontibacter silvestris]